MSTLVRLNNSLFKVQEGANKAKIIKCQEVTDEEKIFENENSRKKREMRKCENRKFYFIRKFKRIQNGINNMGRGTNSFTNFGNKNFFKSNKMRKVHKEEGFAKKQPLRNFEHQSQSTDQHICDKDIKRWNCKQSSVNKVHGKAKSIRENEILGRSKIAIRNLFSPLAEFETKENCEFRPVSQIRNKNENSKEKKKKKKKKKRKNKNKQSEKLKKINQKMFTNKISQFEQNLKNLSTTIFKKIENKNIDFEESLKREEVLMNCRTFPIFGWYTDFTENDFQQNATEIVKKDTLKIVHANIGGGLNEKLRPDHDFYIRIVDGESPDVLILSETMLESGKSPPKIAGFDSYNKGSTRTFNVGRGSGGLAIYVREELSTKICKVKTSKLQNLIWLRIDNVPKPIFLCASYVRPIYLEKHTQENRREFLEELDKQVKEFQKKGEVIVMGDLNSRHKQFGDRENFPGGKLLKNSWTGSKLRCLNNIYQPGKITCHNTMTEGESLVDLAFAERTLIDLVQTFDILEGNFSNSCYHDFLSLELNLKTERKIPKQEQKFQINFDRISPSKFSASLHKVHEKLKSVGEIIKDQQLSKSDSALLTTNFFYFFMTNELCEIVSMKKKRHKRSSNSSGNREIKKVSRQVIRLEKKLSNCESKRKLREARNHLRKLREKQKDLIRQFEYRKFKQKAWRISQCNPGKALWDELNKVRNMAENGDLPEVSIDKNGTYSKTPEENGENWSKHYQGISSMKSEDPNFDKDFCENLENWFQTKKEDLNVESEISELDEKISIHEIVEVLRNLENNKSPGFDQISYRFWKIDVFASASLLKMLYDIFWDCESIPSWIRVCLIKSLLKDPDSNIADPSNYRPIAMSNSIFKIFEGVLKNRLIKVAEAKNWISPFQYGFQPQKGTAMQIFNLRETILEQKRKRLDVHMAFMDLSKAFDSCWRAGIHKQLYELGVRGKLWRIIASCYENTLMSVKTRHGRTQAFETTAGVLQGSMLSPILFLILINDIEKKVKEQKLHNPEVDDEAWDQEIKGVEVGNTTVHCLLYADDIVLLSTCPNELQIMLNRCAEYGKKWRLKFNAKKTEIISYSNTKNKWTLNAKKVKEVQKYKYLGVIFENWGEKLPNQTEKMIKKFTKKCQNVRWLMSSGACFSPSLSTFLYQSLCRPLLEYGAQVLPSISVDFEKLERAQTTQLKLFLGLKPKTKNETVRFLSGKEPLSSRWQKLKLLFANKMSRVPDDWLVKKIWKFRKTVTDPNSLYTEITAICKEKQIELSFVENAPLEAFRRHFLPILQVEAYKKDVKQMNTSIQESTGQPWVVSHILKSEEITGFHQPKLLDLECLTDKHARNTFLQTISGCDFFTPHDYREKKLCPWCNQRKLDTLHVLTGCEKLSNERILFFENVRRKMQNNNVSHLLTQRIEQEKEKFIFHNEPEEKVAEMQPVQTPGNGGFNTQNHQFFVKICQLFKSELLEDKLKMNDMCCLLVEFLKQIQQKFHRISQENLFDPVADNVPD